MSQTYRTVVVELWTGMVVVHRLGPSDQLTDAEVVRRLRAIGVAPIPATVEEQRDRLTNWPTQEDLDAIATDWVASNDGVRPVVRVLESVSLPSRSALAGPAGTVVR